ncbi:MAG: tRNA (N(6)-L-threonylcarbamoyladenosine(37)-C(2))-methylthiotransferase MtaB [Lachnospiraceae bacterium]|nr:tRNA (N(6)-L-threonylcarbamoyladenosine(37)-C(2))-methylthiotransferase MtaB [Lachnospiraceae bacterium]
MKSVALHNLGCKVNGYELDVMGQMLQEKGFKIVPFDEDADIYIINTCTVTNIADRKSRQMLHKAKKKNPDAVVVAVGCYVQTGREAVEKDPCIDLAVGNNRKKDLISILEEFLASKEECRGEETGEKTLHGTTVIDINHTDEYEEMTLEHTADHTRAYIKIQDGCNQFCSYCIIPYARGRIRSRRPEDVLAEVKGLAANGYREIVFTGIHISSYGIDFEQKQTGDYRSAKEEALRKNHFLNLIKAVHEVDGIERIRLGSLEPRIMTEEFVRELAGLSRLCPHFHLSLQSGSDTVLQRMNRHYSSGEYYEKVLLLRKYFSNPAITTDVITGFPQETEEEFEETKAFLEKVHFYEMHIFKYSKRQGTVAASMPGQMTEREKAKRSAVLLEMEKRHSKEYREQFVGRECEVLFEETMEIQDESYMVGHSKRYLKVAVKAGEELSNEIRTCRISGFLTEDILLAETIR